MIYIPSSHNHGNNHDPKVIAALFIAALIISFPAIILYISKGIKTNDWNIFSDSLYVAIGMLVFIAITCLFIFMFMAYLTYNLL